MSKTNLQNIQTEKIKELKEKEKEKGRGVTEKCIN